MGLLIRVLIDPLRRNYKHRQKGHRSHVSLFMMLICILIPFTVKVAKSYGCLRVNKFHYELVPSIGLKQFRNPELWKSWCPRGKVSFAVIYSGRSIIGCMLTRTDGCAREEHKEFQIALLESFLGMMYQEQRIALPFVDEVSPAKVNPSLLALPAAQHPLPNLHPSLFHRAPKGLNNTMSGSSQRAEIPDINVVSLQPLLSHYFALRGCCAIWQQYNPELYISSLWNIPWCQIRFALVEQFLSARGAEAECGVVGVSPVPLLTIMTQLSNLIISF